MIQTHQHNRGIAGRIVIQQTAPAPTISTQMQAPSFRRKILEAAKRDGSLHTLYWHVEFRAPVSLLPPWLKAQKPLMGSVVFVASHPGKHIPVIPVGDDPAISMEYAELLRAWMWSRNRWVQDIGIALMPADLLQGLKWYEWGDRLPAGDEVCRTCGGVGECVCDAQFPMCQECYWSFDSAESDPYKQLGIKCGTCRRHQSATEWEVIEQDGMNQEQSI